jgi:hypothetical protein
MSGPNWLPVVIPIIALITLFGWLAAVYYADRHPGWPGQKRVPGPPDTSLSWAHGASPEIPHQAASPETGPEAGAGTGSAPEPATPADLR